jgi:hypothetical protein
MTATTTRRRPSASARIVAPITSYVTGEMRKVLPLQTNADLVKLLEAFTTGTWDSHPHALLVEQELLHRELAQAAEHGGPLHQGTPADCAGCHAEEFYIPED